MDYRELLNVCKEKAGCLSTNEQKEIESNLTFKTWIEKMNNEYSEKLTKNNK